MVGTVLKGDLQSSIEDQLQQYARGIGSAAGGAASAVQQIPQAVGDTWEDLQRAGRTSTQDVQAQLADYATQAYNASQEAQRQAQEEAQRRAEQAAQVEQELTAHANQALAGAQPAPDQGVAGAQPTAPVAPDHEPSPPLQTAGTQVANTPGAGGQVFPLSVRPDNAPTATYHSQGGSDLMAPRGTPVLNMQNGRVDEVFTDNGSHQVGGNAVLVHGDDGLDYYYAHFDQPSGVKVGQRVAAGEQIGAVGNSGNAYKDGTGATHLHIGIGHGISNGVGSEGGLGENYNAQSLLTQLQDGVGKATSTAQQAVGGAAQDVASKIPAPSQVADYIRYAAAQRGIDPETAVRVAQSEGLNTYTGDQGSSFGPFQLHMGGLAPAGSGNEGSGMGDAFKQATGLDPRDPSSWKQQVDYALSNAASGGWGPWHGAQRVGLGVREGIGAFKGDAEQFAQGAQDALQAAGSAVGGAVGGAVAGARRATGDVIQAGEQAAVAARAPIYGTLAGGRDQAVQQLNVLQSQIDSLRDQLAGAPQGARQAIAGAAEPLIAGAQQTAQDVAGSRAGDLALRSGRTPQEEAGYRQRQLDEVNRLATEQRTAPPPELTPGSVLGGAARLAIENPPTAGPSLEEYRQRQTQVGQAIEQQNPLRDVPFVGGLTSQAAQFGASGQWLIPFGAVTRTGEEVLAAAGVARPLLQRVGGEALSNALQNALYEVTTRTDATPQSVGEAFISGGALGGLMPLGAAGVTRIGQEILSRAPELTPLLRTRQRGEVDLGLITGQGPTPRETPVARPPERPVEPTTRMYHGTGAEFATPEGGRFDPNGLFGPGYYLTDRSEVAGGIVGEGRSELQQQLAELQAKRIGASDRFGYVLDRDIADLERQIAQESPSARVLKQGYAQERAVREGLAPEQRADLQRRVDTGRATLEGNPSPELRAYVERDMAEAQAKLDTEMRGAGANVRAVDVPQNLRLLDVDTPAGPATATVTDALKRVYGPRSGKLDLFDNFIADTPDPTGEHVYRALQRSLTDAGQSPNAANTEVNRVLRVAGYDGITYSGGKRIPMTDAGGAPIEHQATVIFPESLPKIRNAVSGRQGGQANVPFAANLGGAAFGGYAGNLATPADATPEERARNIAAGAAAGLGGTHLISRGLGGRLAPEAVGRPTLEAQLAARPAEGFRAPGRPETPELRATTQAAPGGPPTGGGASPELDRLNAMYGDKKAAPTGNLQQRLQSIGDNVTRALTDRQVDINRAQERYAANLGRPLRGDEMAAELQRLASDPVAQVKVDEGLKPAIQSVGADYPALRNYVTLRSNIEVADALAARTGKPEVGTDRLFSGGLNREQSVKALQDLEDQLGPERFERVKAAADQVTAFNHMLRQRLVDAQVLDPQVAAALDVQYPNWVKTRILDYMADPTGGQGAGTKLGLNDRGLREYTLTGTERAREDPIASTVAYAHQVERMAMKNEAFNAFLQIDQGGTSPMLHQVPQSYSPKANEVTMIGFVNGEKQKFVTDNQALGAAINGAGVMATPEWTSAWQKVFRSLATSRNPLFLAGNAALDIPTYVLRESVREGGPQALPRIMGELARGYGDAFQGLFQGEFRGAGTSAFLKGGGGQAGFFTGGEGMSKRAVAEMQRKNVFQISSPSDLGRLTKDLLTLHPVEALGERIELGPRVAAMRLAERRGANPTQAIIDGRTVTVDFSQGGTVTKYLNNFIPFFNVGFQAPAQIARAFRDNPRAFVATVGTLIGIPSAAAEVWNRSDPQRAQDYKDVPQDVKDQGIVIMLPGDAPVDAKGNRKPMYAVIKLREWTPFAAIAREATGRVMGDDSRSWQDAAKSIGSGLLPTNATSLAQLGTEPTTGIPVLPAAAQLAMNRDFFRNRDIVTQRADQSASTLAKSLTPIIQKAIDEAGIPGEIRPSAIDFLIQNQGAGVGSATLAASNLAGGQENPNVGPTALPGVGGLIGRFAGNRTGQDLQDARDQAFSEQTRQILRTNGITTTIGPVGSTVGQIPLTQEEETRYQQLANQYVDDTVRRTAASEGFATRPQISRQGIMDAAVTGAKARAAAEVVKSIDVDERARRIKAAAAAKVAA